MSDEREFKPVRGTYAEYSDKREAEEAARPGPVCVGCGLRRKFNREQYRLRTVVRMDDGKFWHVACYKSMHRPEVK